MNLKKTDVSLFQTSSSPSLSILSKFYSIKTFEALKLVPRIQKCGCTFSWKINGRKHGSERAILGQKYFISLKVSWQTDWLQSSGGGGLLYGTDGDARRKF